LTVGAVFLATGTESKQYFNLISEYLAASPLKLTKIANFYPRPVACGFQKLPVPICVIVFCKRS